MLHVKLCPVLGREEEPRLGAIVSLQAVLSQHCFPAATERAKLPNSHMANTRKGTVWTEKKMLHLEMEAGSKWGELKIYRISLGEKTQNFLIRIRRVRGYLYLGLLSQ